MNIDDGSFIALGMHFLHLPDEINIIILRARHRRRGVHFGLLHRNLLTRLPSLLHRVITHAVEDVIRGKTSLVDGRLRDVESHVCLRSKAGEVGIVDGRAALVLLFVDDRGHSGSHAGGRPHVHC